MLRVCTKQSKRGDKEWSGAGASGCDDGWPAYPRTRTQHHQQPEHSHQQVYMLGNDVDEGGPREVPPGTMQAGRPCPCVPRRGRRRVVVDHRILALSTQVSLPSTLSLALFLSFLA